VSNGNEITNTFVYVGSMKEAEMTMYLAILPYEQRGSHFHKHKSMFFKSEISGSRNHKHKIYPTN
jgi:hypothetical protein